MTLSYLLDVWMDGTAPYGRLAHPFVRSAEPRGIVMKNGLKFSIFTKIISPADAQQYTNEKHASKTADVDIASNFASLWLAL